MIWEFPQSYDWGTPLVRWGTATRTRRAFMTLPLSQGTLSAAYPTFQSTEPRYRRQYESQLVRRTQFQVPGWGQGTLGVAYPTFQATEGIWRRTYAQARARRGRFAEPAWPQGLQFTAWPTFTVAETRFRRQYQPQKIRRTKYAEPGWGQGNQGQAWPSFENGGTYRQRQYTALSGRGRRVRDLNAEPNWPQVLVAASGGTPTRAVDVLPLIPKEIG